MVIAALVILLLAILLVPILLIRFRKHVYQDGEWKRKSHGMATKPTAVFVSTTNPR